MKRLTPLPPHEAVPEVDHNVVHLCEQGFWWCRSCQKVTTLVPRRDHFDPTDEYNGCFYCWGRNVKWNEPVFVEEPRRKYG